MLRLMLLHGKFLFFNLDLYSLITYYRIYEVMGARSIAHKAGFDHFWRNIRTHSLHDPVAHKRAEVGRFVLSGELPNVSIFFLLLMRLLTCIILNLADMVHLEDVCVSRNLLYRE